MRIRPTALFVPAPVLLAACDGGDSGDGPPPNDGKITATAPPTPRS